MSGGRIRIRRKNAFNLIREAQKLESFDEFPMMRPELDPQVHASRNSVDQPFFLTCQKDSVVALASGRAQLRFVDGPVRYFDLGPGDFAYVPAGATHRIYTRENGIQIRYKANDPGAESVSWYCQECDTSLYKHEFDASAAPAQRGYQAGCEAFNADPVHRHCAKCGADHPPVDLSQFRWEAVAVALAAEDQ